MPELYANQIKISGTSQPRASAAKLDNSVGEALSALGNQMGKFALEKAAAEDAQLRIKVSNKAKEAQILLEDADASDFNYEEKVAQANAIYASAFDGFNKDAINRFHRDHPDADTVFSMEMDSIALKKSREQNYNNFSQELDSMASQVALGQQTADFYKSQIDSTQMTTLQKKALKEGLDKSVTEYNIAANLSYGTEKSLAAARTIIKDTNNNLSPQERIMWAERLNVAADRHKQAAKDKAKDRVQQIEDVLLEQYLQIAHESGWGAANDFRTGIEQLHGEVNLGSVIINTEDPKSPNFVPQTVIHGALKNIKEKTAETASSIIYDVTQERRANNVIEYYNNWNKKGHKQGMLEMSQQAMLLLQDAKTLKKFDKDTQDKIVELAYAPTDSVMEAVGGLNKYAHKTTGEHRPGTLVFDIGLPWTQSMPLPVKRLYDAVTSENTNVNDVSDALYYQRKMLEDTVLNGELAINAGTNAAVLRDAYLQLDAISRNPQQMAKLGYRNVSPAKLAEAFSNTLYALKAGNSYDVEFDSTSKERPDFVKMLLDNTQGAQALPYDEERNMNLGRIRINAEITSSADVVPQDSALGFVGGYKGRPNLRTTNLYYPNTVGKKTGFGK